MKESIFSQRPAVRFVAYLVLGILCSYSLHIPSSWVLVVVVPILGLSAIFVMVGNKSFRVNLILHVLVFLIGFYSQSSQREYEAEKKLDPKQGQSLLFTARIESEPVRQQKKASFVLSVEKLEWANGHDSSPRRILTTLRGLDANTDLSALRCGSRIVGRATLEPFPIQRNPGEFDYGRYLTLNDIQGIATIAAPDDFVVTKESVVSSFNAFVGSMQRSLYGILDRYHSPEQASFLKGVILGYRADLSNEIKQSFMNTGTIHILAVSGSNVAVIVLIIYSMFGFLRLPKRLSGGATIIGIVLFMFITGASPSVVRATIMASVLLMGSVFERKTDVYNSLCVAALFILLLDTNALFDVGFQLSFAAVLSIVYIYPILKKLIDLIPERFEEIKAVDYVLKLFAVSLAAQIGTLPFTAYYFGRVSLVALLANLIVVPLSGLNVLLGVATIAFSSISPFIATCYSTLNSIAIDFLLGFVRVAGNAPYAYVETAQFGQIHALLYYAIIAVLLHLTSPKIVKWGMIASLGLLSFILAISIVQNKTGILKMTVLDVGQGDAILVESPHHKLILIDAGPKQFNYDAGERTIVPYCSRNGIKKLDAMILTHSHSDHIGGMPYIMDHVNVLSFMPSGFEAHSSLFRKVKETVRRDGISERDVQRGECISLDPNIRLYVLHPRSPEDIHKSLNNTSVVVKLVYGRCSALLVGDAENESEAKMCGRYGDFLASTVLKVGHHGSRTSSSGLFLQKVRPVVAMVSVGNRNKFGHPSEETLARLVRFGSKVYRTDKEGAIVLECDGTSWWKDDWRNDVREEVCAKKEG